MAHCLCIIFSMVSGSRRNDKFIYLCFSLKKNRFIGKYRNYTQSIFNNYDLLITPTVAVKPFKINEYPEEINGNKCNSPFWDWTPFTYIFNLTGNPAASIPVSRSKDNLPIGMQVVGDLMQENLILAFAKLIESEEPWNSYPEIK